VINCKKFFRFQNDVENSKDRKRDREELNDTAKKEKKTDKIVSCQYLHPL